MAVALLIVTMLFGAMPAQAARGGGGGSGGSGSHGGSSQGGGHGSGNWHHNGSFHNRGTFFVGVSPWWWGGYWNAPYWYYPYPYYPYPYYPYPYYSYPYNYPSGYPPTGMYGSGEGVTYIEQSPAPAPPPTAYWYYCESPPGYYPSIAQCAQWILVDPQAPR